MPIYETLFDVDTKEVTRHSEVTEYESLDEVEMMHGDPMVSRGSYQVHAGGVLFSTFAWSIKSAANATGDPVWAG